MRLSVVRSLTLCSSPCSFPCVSPIFYYLNLDLYFFLMWPSSGQFSTGTPPLEESGTLAENAPLTVLHFFAKDQSRIHQFGKKIFPGMFLGHASVRVENLEGWHTGCRHWGVGSMDSSGIYSKRLKCKRGDTSQRKLKIHFPGADGRIKLPGGDQELRTLTRDFLGESEGSLPPPQDSLPDAGEAIYDFWSMSGNFKNRRHVEPGVKLYSPREESFPIPVKYIDVSRATHTNLDVKQERRIDDYWNIDGSKDLSDSWTGFTQVTLIGRETSRRMYVVRRETDKAAGNIQARFLDEIVNARRLRGIYFIDLEDKEFKETIKNARGNWKHPWIPLCFARQARRTRMETLSKTNDFKSKFACILEASESTRLRMEESPPNYHEDHIAGKGDNSLQHCKLVQRIFLSLKTWRYVQQ